MCFTTVPPAGDGRRMHKSNHLGSEHLRATPFLLTSGGKVTLPRREHAACCQTSLSDDYVTRALRISKACYFTGWSGTGWVSYLGKRVSPEPTSLPPEVSSTGPPVPQIYPRCLSSIGAHGTNRVGHVPYLHGYLHREPHYTGPKGPTSARKRTYGYPVQLANMLRPQGPTSARKRTYGYPMLFSPVYHGKCIMGLLSL